MLQLPYFAISSLLVLIGAAVLWPALLRLAGYATRRS
jgi:hypothetical protein